MDKLICCGGKFYFYIYERFVGAFDKIRLIQNLFEQTFIQRFASKLNFMDTLTGLLARHIFLFTNIGNKKIKVVYVNA